MLRYFVHLSRDLVDRQTVDLVEHWIVRKRQQNLADIALFLANGRSRVERVVLHERILLCKEGLAVELAELSQQRLVPNRCQQRRDGVNCAVNDDDFGELACGVFYFLYFRVTINSFVALQSHFTCQVSLEVDLFEHAKQPLQQQHALEHLIRGLRLSAEDGVGKRACVVQGQEVLVLNEYGHVDIESLDLQKGIFYDLLAVEGRFWADEKAQVEFCELVLAEQF